MSVRETNKVDFISEDKSGNIVLTISDHLLWDEENTHLSILQEKINAYLSFIESGEVYTSYPNSKGKKFVIRVVMLHEPNEIAREFLNHVKNTLSEAGYSFEFIKRSLLE